VVKVADHAAINHRRVGCPRSRHPPFDFGLQPRIVAVKAKRGEAGDDISPQVAHLDLIDARDVSSGDAPTIGIEHKKHPNRRRSGRQALVRHAAFPACALRKQSRAITLASFAAMRFASSLFIAQE